jgi:cysteine desulfurase/selenocysteine lyase
VTLDVARIRADFPGLAQEIEGRRLVYLDSAATAQKPIAVLEAMDRYYRGGSGNPNRGAHELAVRAAEVYERARESVRRFIGASSSHEVIFTSGTTASINAVADALRRRGLFAEDAEIAVTVLEHHSNFVPWQRAAAEAGARLVVVPCHASGVVDLDALERAVTERTALVAIAHVSNVLGTLQPLEEVVRVAKRRGALVLVDGAQAVPHRAVDVRALGADFYAFSAHKLYGPYGIGVLYANESAQRWMEPYQTGGGMVHLVTSGQTSFAPPPQRFEAGTPNVAGAVGLAAAIEYVCSIGMSAIEGHGRALAAYAREALSAIDRVRLLGEGGEGIVSFVIDGIHAHDAGTILDRRGVAVRVGHHCAQPLMQHLGLHSTARASFAVYNDRDDVDALAGGIRAAIELFRR